MKYSEWETKVPKTLKNDPLWRVTAYRLATFVSDIGWHDITKLAKDKRTADLSGQLYEALGSIGANLAEGYSRGTGRDRARFYEYSLGSARESRDWYYKGRHILGDTVVDHRMCLLSEITQILLAMIPDQRGKALHEESAEYSVNAPPPEPDLSHLRNLLENVPMPDP